MIAHSDHYTKKLYKLRQGPEKRGPGVSLRTLW